MKKIFDILRFIFISPEFLVAIAIYFILPLYPDLLVFIKTKFIEVYKKEWFLGIMIASLLYNYKVGESLLNPKSDDNRKLLKRFPEYWKLKSRIYYSLILPIISACIAIYSLYDLMDKNSSCAITLLLIAIVVTLITSITLAIANLELRDILI